MVAMVASPAVLSTALQNPSLQGTFLVNEPTPREWLEENLTVEFHGESELLEISLRGPEEAANDLKSIVDAVTQAFMDEVVMKDRFERSKDLASLEHTYAEYQMQLRQKLTELARVRTEAGDADVRLRGLEIESLERTFTLLADRIQHLELELERPSQIKLVDPAHITQD
jgi:hypothetical protein